MDEKVYCTHCDSSNVRTIAGTTQITSWIKRGMVIRESTYSPIYHQCDDCGHTFLSISTNLHEIAEAYSNKKKSIISAVVLVAVCSLLLYAGIQNMTVGMIVGGVIGLIGAVFCVVSAVQYQRNLNVLNQYLSELENSRAKHSRNLF